MGHVYNRFVEGAFFYKLFYGNADPMIEFTNEYSMEDYDPAVDKNQRKWDEIIVRKPTFAELLAVGWQLDKFLKAREDNRYLCF